MSTTLFPEEKTKKERTFVFFKPNIVKNNELQKALDMFFGDMKIIKLESRQLPVEFFKEFYKHIPEPSLTLHSTFCSSGPIEIAILEADNAVKKVRERIGCSDSSKAKPDTLRGYYYRKYHPVDGYDNFAHSSESKEAAENEMKFFQL